MHHSQSTSSICSLGIGTSQSCNNLAIFSQHPQQLSSPNLRQIWICKINNWTIFSGSVPDLNFQNGGNTGKLIHSQMSSNDSDPDYNVTLTAESLRQTIQHQMEAIQNTEFIPIFIFYSGWFTTNWPRASISRNLLTTNPLAKSKASILYWSIHE